MDGSPSAMIYCSLWLCAVSGCVGCAIGMGLMRWQMRRMGSLPGSAPDVVPSPSPEQEPEMIPSASPSREELRSLFASLTQISSEMDARVGQHTIRVAEINQSLDAEQDDNRDLLMRATKLLLAANEQLKTDLDATKSELQDQRELVDCFKTESRTDALTQLANRRAFESEINQSLKSFNRDRIPFSLLLIDIDHFKRINDEHGHLNGDQVLATVAACLRSSLPETAFVSRYGGEEFAVILRGTTRDAGLKIAEQLRCDVQNCRHDLSGVDVHCTVSIGIGESVEGDTRSELIKRSDQALFAAKNSGRNRCLVDHDLSVEKSVHFSLNRAKAPNLAAAL